jgi:hypothetical protein
MDARMHARIEELQRDLDIMEQIEEAARNRVAGIDEDWNRDRDHIIEKMFNLVSIVKPDDPPHKAVHVLGQLLADVEKLRAPKRICVELDSKRKLIHTLRDRQRGADDASAKAQEAYDNQSWRASS